MYVFQNSACPQSESVLFCSGHHCNSGFGRAAVRPGINSICSFGVLSNIITKSMDIIKLTALDRYAHRNLLHRNVFGRTNYRCAFLLCFKQSYKIGIYLSRGNAQKVLFAVGTQCKILIIIRPTLGYRRLFDVFYHSFPFKRHSAVYLCLCLPPPKHLLSLLCLTPPCFCRACVSPQYPPQRPQSV